MRPSLLERLDRVPPCIARLVARKNHGRTGLSHEDIARSSGLALSTVSLLSLKKSWKSVSLETASAFLEACGVDMFRLERTLEFLRRRKMIHLVSGGRTQRRFYARLVSGHADDGR